MQNIIIILCLFVLIFNSIAIQLLIKYVKRMHRQATENGAWNLTQLSGLKMEISNLIKLINKVELESLKEEVESINEYLATISQEAERNGLEGNNNVHLSRR